MTGLEYITFADTKGLETLNDGAHALVHGLVKNGNIAAAKSGEQVEELYIMSALIKPKDFNKYLKNKEFYNYPFNQLGNPGIWAEGESDKIQFTLGQTRDDNQIKAHYFVRSYNPHGVNERRYLIAQSFIFYHELTERSRKYSHIYVDELNDQEVICEELNPAADDGQFRVKINRHYLREYLGARKMGLAVWISIRRYAELENDIDQIDKADGNRLLTVRKADWMSNSKHKIYTGELVIKTVIRPYSNISWSEKNWSHTRNKQKVPMIIGIDEKTGELILSDNSTTFLKSVFFKKEVLTKYIDDERSSVGTSSQSLGNIKYLDQWHMVYGLNEYNRVVVWLGDLQERSYEEQTYWRHFNIPPEGSIGDDFYKTQIMGQWAEGSESLETKVLVLRSDINKITVKLYGKLLYKTTSDDEEFEKQLHTAIKSGSKALKPQINGLARLFVDALDKKLLARLITDKTKLLTDKGKPIGSINLLQVLYSQETGNTLSICDTLHLIWKIRGLYSHVFDEQKYIKVIDSYDDRLDPLDPSTLYPYIMIRLIRELTWFKMIWDKED